MTLNREPLLVVAAQPLFSTHEIPFQLSAAEIYADAALLTHRQLISPSRFKEELVSLTIDTGKKVVLKVNAKLQITVRNS